MRWLLSLLILTYCSSSNAQTKKETEEWILYNLKTYFSSTVDRDNRIAEKDMFKKYTYYAYNYSFLNNFLKIEEYKYVEDSAFHVQTTKTKTEIIDLSKIIKVESSIDSINLNYIGIELKFNDDVNQIDFDERAVKIYEGEDLVDVTSKKGYQLNYHIFSRLKESVMSKINSRMAKAFEHIATLNGAKIIKDVF